MEQRKKRKREEGGSTQLFGFVYFYIVKYFLLKCQKKITSLFQNVQLLYNKRAFLCYGIEIYWNPSSWKEKGESILIAISNSLFIKWRTVGLNIRSRKTFSRTTLHFAGQFVTAFFVQEKISRRTGQFHQQQKIN